jgi:hypothetical protein
MVVDVLAHHRRYFTTAVPRPRPVGSRLHETPSGFQAGDGISDGSPYLGMWGTGRPRPHSADDRHLEAKYAAGVCARSWLHE